MASDVATIMAGLAEQGGFHFENNGVQVQFFDPYFPGTVLEQIQRCAAKAGINHTIDHQTNTLAIWPRGGSRGGKIPLISPTTGMIGYPVFDPNGVLVTTTYNPSIRTGQIVQVQSSLQAANGQWGVNSLEHELESQVPGGQWRTRFLGIWLGAFIVSKSPFSHG
jgi:hypothetical protein